jgi:hypothetical protein
MISDTLSEAVTEINRYLSDPAFSRFCSEPALFARTVALRNEMDAVRQVLDTPPTEIDTKSTLNGEKPLKMLDNRGFKQHSLFCRNPCLPGRGGNQEGTARGHSRNI